MTDLRKAAEMALEALNIQTPLDKREFELRNSAIEALRQALAQPEQEPVALLHISPNYKCATTYLKPKRQEHPYPLNDTFETIPVYAAPPKREWVGLTDEELKVLCDEWQIIYGGYVRPFAETIEAKLKEKNGG